MSEKLVVKSSKHWDDVLQWPKGRLFGKFSEYIFFSLLGFSFSKCLEVPGERRPSARLTLWGPVSPCHSVVCSSHTGREGWPCWHLQLHPAPQTMHPMLVNLFGSLLAQAWLNPCVSSKWHINYWSCLMNMLMGRILELLLCSPGPHPFLKRCLEQTASGATPRLRNEGNTLSSRAGACPSGGAAETCSVWQLFLRFRIRLFTLSQCKWEKLLVLLHLEGDKVWPHFPLQMKGEGEKNKWKEVQPGGEADNILTLKHSFCLHLQCDYRSCQASLSPCCFSSSGEITRREQKVHLARPWLRVLNAGFECSPKQRLVFKLLHSKEPWVLWNACRDLSFMKIHKALWLE